MPGIEFVQRFKVVLLGDSCVGKSNILSRFAYERFDKKSKSTIGVEFSNKLVQVKTNDEKDSPDKSVKLQVWDTAGQEKYDAMTETYFRNVDAAILVVDLTLPAIAAFERSERWIEKLKKRNRDSDVYPILFLAANKTDLRVERRLKAEELKEFSVKHNMTLFETSALTGESISLMFQTVAEQLYHASGIYSPEKHLSKANSELRVPAVTDKEDSWNCCRVQ